MLITAPWDLGLWSPQQWSVCDSHACLAMAGYILAVHICVGRLRALRYILMACLAVIASCRICANVSVANYKTYVHTALSPDKTFI